MGLSRFTFHASRCEVRREALNKLEQHRLISAIEPVKRKVETEESAVIRGDALCVLGALGENEVLSQIVPYLEHPEPEVRMGAMVGLLRSGGMFKKFNDGNGGTISTYYQAKTKYSQINAALPILSATDAFPTNFDTDKDGMPNAWEIANGLNPNANDSKGDLDNDGYTNIEEYLNTIDL